MKTEFPRQNLAAAAQFMADQDVRYYLKGVYVEALPNETRLTATDGSVAATLRYVRQNETTADVIVPADTVAIAVKFPFDMLTLECVEGRWSLAGIPFVPVDGKFPDYRRVIPTAWSGAAGNYDPALVQKFVKAGKALKLKGAPLVRQNGEHGAALVHFYASDNFVGVLMPLRMFTEKTPDLGAPTWGPVRS